MKHAYVLLCMLRAPLLYCKQGLGATTHCTLPCYTAQLNAHYHAAMHNSVHATTRHYTAQISACYHPALEILELVLRDP